jgi:alpha-L-rhamnosidase
MTRTLSLRLLGSHRPLLTSAALRATRTVAVIGLFTVFGASAFSQTGKPEKLECESLPTPLGMDTPQPRLSWQLRDARFGALQTAYQIRVASTAPALVSGKADIWDSGRVDFGASRNILYAGPVLEPSKRYFWRVQLWDQAGQPYPPSDITWWETGLMVQKNWRSKWISYQEPELRAVRESGAMWITNSQTQGPKASSSALHAFRFQFTVTGTIRRASLYVTGQDSPEVWISGAQLLQPEPMPAWHNLPWRTYKVRDVTQDLHTGQNTLAIGVLRYLIDPKPDAQAPAQTPMSAVLYLELQDGSIKVLRTGDSGWRAALNPDGMWQNSGFDDAAWKQAVRYVPPTGPREPTELGHPWPTGSVKSLRKTFQIEKPIVSARVYATALGAYKLFLNGQPVGDQILAPGWTDYRARVIYQTYDVTSQLKSGKNAIGALLAPGWYATPLMWAGQGNNYGDTPPALRAQMRIAYQDGSIDWVITDESWKADPSPILSAEIYNGETYDAQKKQPGWETAAFSDGKWKSVEVTQPHEPEIRWQYFQPIRVERTLSAKTVTNPTAGIYVFDFGQNLSGVARVRAKGPAGTDIKLRFAEVLNPDGTIYTDNLRTAKATDHFILAGKGTQEYQPAFTFHGFRYVEVSGFPGKPAHDDVTAVAFHSDAPFTATLSTGSPMLNQLWSNILWGQRSNFVGVPTDCPQRDERLGWTADAQVFWRTATYNMDLATFSRKFGADLRGTQVGTDMYGIFAPGTEMPNPGFGTGWSDAGVVIPWTSWIQTGDPMVIEENWTAMEKYLAAIQAANPDFTWKHDYGIPFADWLSPEGVTPVDLIATAYWAYDVTLMQQMARASGRNSDEQKYAALFEKIKIAFNQAWVRPDGFVGGVPPPAVFPSGVSRILSDKPVETQTGYVLALHMNLLPDALRPVAAQRLVDRLAANHWRLGTGFLGTPYLLSALTDTGHADVAYRLLLSTEYPSWGYLVDHGATTMWERWNGDQMRSDPSMNSYNHYAYGAVADWIYRYAAGIDTVPDDPGFHTILLRPNFDRSLSHVDFSYDSGYGTIHSSWQVTGSSATWKLTIPANAKGRLPLSSAALPEFKLGGKTLPENSKLRHVAGPNGAEVFDVPAGSYEFKIDLRSDSDPDPSDTTRPRS